MEEESDGARFEVELTGREWADEARLEVGVTEREGADMTWLVSTLNPTVFTHGPHTSRDLKSNTCDSGDGKAIHCLRLGHNKLPLR